jgi:hypothetical protein
MSHTGAAVVRRVRAWDTVNNVAKTGDSANMTLYLAADGAAPAAIANAITEEGRGYYRVTLTALQNVGTAMHLSGSSSTSGVMIVGAQWDNTPSVAAIADAVWDEELSGHTAGAGGELHEAKVILGNDYEADDDLGTFEFEDDDGSTLATHTYEDTETGHTRSVS